MPAQRVLMGRKTQGTYRQKVTKFATLVGQEACPDRTDALAGGDGEIRTHGGVAPSAVFKTAALDHSATSPVATLRPPRAEIFA